MDRTPHPRARAADIAVPLDHAPVTELDVRHALAELVFPAGPEEILEAARAHDVDEPVVAFLCDLVDREFESLDHLIDAVRTTLASAHTALDSGLELDAGRSALFDINQADVSDLEEVEGIDRELAERIIQVREALGGFRTVDDLLEISELDPDTLEHLRRSAAI